MRTLYFAAVVTFFFFLGFSSPNRSGRRLEDVYHTSAHGVALVRIYNACLKYAARGSLKIQDAKITQKIAICTPSHKFVRIYQSINQSKPICNAPISPSKKPESEVCIDNRKNVKQQYLIQMSSQYGKLRPINEIGEIG